MSLGERVMTWMEQQVAVGWALAVSTLVLAVAAVYPAAEVWWEGLARAREDAEQRRDPIVTMQGELVARRNGAVLVHIWGVKHRDCEYRGIQGFSVAPDGVMHDALMVRLDTPETGRTKPTGAYDLGVWSVSPAADDAMAVRAYVQHRCGRSDITTLIANVPLVETPL